MDYMNMFISGIDPSIHAAYFLQWSRSQLRSLSVRPRLLSSAGAFRHGGTHIATLCWSIKNIFQSVGFMPMLAPIITLYCMQPYKEWGRSMESELQTIFRFVISVATCNFTELKRTALLVSVLISPQSKIYYSEATSTVSRIGAKEQISVIWD